MVMIFCILNKGTDINISQKHKKKQQKVKMSKFKFFNKAKLKLWTTLFQVRQT